MNPTDAINTFLREYISASTLVLAIVAAGGALIAFIGLTSIRRVSLADEAKRVSGLREPSLVQRLQLWLNQTGLRIRATEFLAVGLMLGAGAAAILLLLRLHTMALLALPVGPFGYYLWLVGRRDRELRAFREQLPDAIDDFKEFYKTGNAVIDTAVEQMARSAPPLVRPEFERVQALAAQLPGKAMQEALRRVGQSRAEPFFRQFLDALAGNKAKGGALEPVLDRIARSQRAQLALQNQIRAQQAGGRVVGLVYGIAPPVFVLMLKVSGGMFADFYESLLGQALQAFAVAAGAFSYWAVLQVGRRGVFLDELSSPRLNPDEHADPLDLKHFDANDGFAGVVYTSASRGDGPGARAARAAGATGYGAQPDDWLAPSSVRPTFNTSEDGDE